MAGWQLRKPHQLWVLGVFNEDHVVDSSKIFFLAKVLYIYIYIISYVKTWNHVIETTIYK